MAFTVETCKLLVYTTSVVSARMHSHGVTYMNFANSGYANAIGGRSIYGWFHSSACPVTLYWLQIMASL